MDILTPVGFANMIWQTLNLKPGAGFWSAPVCSTWVYLPGAQINMHENRFPRSRGSTGRTKGRPLGWQDRESVRAGNVMVSRVCLLLLLCQCKGIVWALEQPCNSLLEGHPCFQKLMTQHKMAIHRVSTCLQYFGGPTRKPTWIYSRDLANYHDLSCC